MRKLTKLGVAGLVSMLASTLVHAMPLLDGAAYFDSFATRNPSRIFRINAEGFENLTLEFSAIGGGTIDPCHGRDIQDCLSVSTNDITLLSGLSITNDRQIFGPLALELADTSFDLVFDAMISGSDESMSIDWQVFGDRVLLVPEPSTIALLSLGLIGFGIARRR